MFDSPPPVSFCRSTLKFRIIFPVLLMYPRYVFIQVACGARTMTAAAAVLPLLLLMMNFRTVLPAAAAAAVHIATAVRRVA